MEAKTDGTVSRCIFLWKIENVSSWWMKTRIFIESPTFFADVLEDTKWSLVLHPMELNFPTYAGLYLNRNSDYNGPSKIEVNFQLAFLAKDGSILREMTTKEDRIFGKYGKFGKSKFVQRDRVFISEREAFLPQDTLTVQCTVWKKGEMPIKTKHFYARTVFKMNLKSFVWRIHNFSNLKSGLGKKSKDSLIEFDLVLKDKPDFKKEMFINLLSFDESVKYFSFKTYVVDSEGKKENCGFIEYFYDDLETEVLSSLLLFSNKWMENKGLYLPNDVLSFDCEQVILAQTDFCGNLPIDALCFDCKQVILAETDFNGFFPSIMTSSKSTRELAENRDEHYIEKGKSLKTPVLMNDLRSVYNDTIFSDTELRTPTHTFPAHKVILGARSSVFRGMFSSDMKEKNSGHVNVDDMDNDTVHRMLLFMYTDSLEDLKFESASKLYTAADKYDILSLKNRCASFLKENLCLTNACKILLLADQHQDVDLKCFLQDYMLEHDQEIFGSPEWTNFIDTHPKLAAHVMQMKYKPSV